MLFWILDFGLVYMAFRCDLAMARMNQVQQEPA